MKTVVEELRNLVERKFATNTLEAMTPEAVGIVANRLDALEARVLALETWKRPKPSPTNEATGPSDDVPATSIPPEKGQVA